MEKNIVMAIILVIAFLYISQGNNVSVKEHNQSVYTPLINPQLISADVSFTGINEYVPGTALTSEDVRIFMFNSATKDLGSKSLDSGTIGVTPDDDYRFYFFFNSTGPSDYYYVDIQDYTAKLQDSADNVVGYGCQIDTNPTIVVRTSGGNVQSATANAQSLSASSSVDVEIDVKSHAGKCYGMPGATKGNAICFGYDSSIFSNIKPNTNSISVPTSISSFGIGTVNCYEFPVLENGADDTLTVHLSAGTTEPTISHNISIYVDDIAFDLNSDNLNEIVGFTDEKGNQLAHRINSTPRGYIYIS